MTEVPYLETTRAHPEVVADIYLNSLSSADKDYVLREQAEIINPQDPGGIELYNNLRQSLKELDTEEGWQRTKELARDELRFIKPDFLEQAFEHFAPLLKCMLAGHSKGHALRDAANLTAMMHDPELELKKIDEVELLVGITAGVFHDIGTSIIDRYKDVKRVGAHAEVGAVLFGRAARGVIPPNLTRLIQYAIVSHTHYLTDREVMLEDGSKATQATYADDTAGGHREAIWLARQADRMDMSNIIQTIRDMIIHVQPIQDFSLDLGTFYQEKKVQENFLTYYGLSPDRIDKSIIGHDIMYAKNVFRQNPYTSHDSDYFTHQLMEPGVADLLLFLTVIARDKRDELLAEIEQNDLAAAERLKGTLANHARATSSASSEHIDELKMDYALERFKETCRVIEPAEDLESQLELFETQFPTLPAEDQEKWVRAFIFMSNVLMPRWKNRMADRLSINLHLGDKITSHDPATRQQFEELGVHLQNIARQVVEVMDPTISQP